MFQIVVFDERRSSERTRKILEQYAQKNQMSFQIETIFEEQKLLKFLEDHQDLDVVFLDIRMYMDKAPVTSCSLGMQSGKNTYKTLPQFFSFCKI